MSRLTCGGAGMRIGRSVLDRRDGAGVGIAFWAIVLAMLPGVLDQTILATALPTIASDLGRLADVSWVVTAYVVAAAAAAPLWGKLGDRNGRKLVLEASLTMFLVASAVCGVAQSLWMLVVARGDPGPGRRWAHVAGPGRGGRPGLAARARPLPGLHHGRVRRCCRARSAARRSAGRPRQLAVGLLRQPAGRGAGARRPAPVAAIEPRARRRGAGSTCPAPGCWPSPAGR